MRNKEMRGLPLNLQFFAEGDGAGGEDGGGTGGKQTFDEILALGHQAEFDRRLQKAVNTAVTNAQEKWRLMTDDKVSEAEKLAKMTKEEKERYLMDKRVKQLEEREANAAKRELMAEAKNTLTEKNLPVGLAEVLNYTNADSCKQSIETMEKAFQEAVQTAVEAKLRGGEPIKKAPEQDNDLAKQVEALMMGRF